VLAAQLERFVPGRRTRAIPAQRDENGQQHNDEPTAA
jgi:hypothetical protein